MTSNRPLWLRRIGMSAHDVLVFELVLGALLTPWSVEIKPLKVPQTFGGQSPITLLCVLSPSSATRTRA